MADEQITREEERGVLAGEYALGVLEGEESAAARRLVLSDRGFADLVRWWEDRLAVMAEDAVAQQPSERVWPAIEHRLGLQDAVAQPRTVERATGLSGARLWGALAASAAAAAAITLLVVNPVARQPAPVPTPQETQLASATRYVANAQSEDGAIRLAGLVEPDSNLLQVRVEGLAPGEGQAAELWAVPEGGAPRSLGTIPADGIVSLDLAAAQRSALGTGAALAVTYEDPASIPNDAPTSDILIVSPLTEI